MKESKLKKLTDNNRSRMYTVKYLGRGSNWESVSDSVWNLVGDSIKIDLRMSIRSLISNDLQKKLKRNK